MINYKFSEIIKIIIIKFFRKIPGQFQAIIQKNCSKFMKKSR